MKPESLQALLIDHELGELTPEAAELLTAWLAEHPETASSVSSIQRMLATASHVVNRHPEVVRPECNVVALPISRPRFLPVALVASILVLLCGSSWVGFLAGRNSVQKSLPGSFAAETPENSTRNNGPWARYALAAGPQGKLIIVRRDTTP